MVLMFEKVELKLGKVRGGWFGECLGRDGSSEGNMTVVGIDGEKVLGEILLDEVLRRCTGGVRASGGTMGDRGGWGTGKERGYSEKPSSDLTCDIDRLDCGEESSSSSEPRRWRPVLSRLVAVLPADKRVFRPFSMHWKLVSPIG